MYMQLFLGRMVSQSKIFWLGQLIKTKNNQPTNHSCSCFKFGKLWCSINGHTSSAVLPHSTYIHSCFNHILRSEAGCLVQSVGTRHPVICPSDSLVWLWHSSFWLACLYPFLTESHTYTLVHCCCCCCWWNKVTINQLPQRTDAVATINVFK